jgi:uncharacterized protein YprB with RNaseH-like and TPR domain
MWESGVVDWSGAGPHRPNRIDPQEYEEAIGGSRLAWERADAAWFGRRLPSKERWRIYNDFHAHAAYLDIETTGAARGVDAITCVAVATKGGVRTYVKDRNLERFPESIRDASIVVTFNGGAFDLPFLRDAFGEGAFEAHAHFDVCVALRRLGRRGGLKRIEKELGIPRDEGLDGADGRLAVDLWHRHLAGDPRALPTLERYCAEDVLGLPALAAIANNGLLALTPFAGRLPELPVPRRIESTLPFSRALVAECLAARPVA